MQKKTVLVIEDSPAWHGVVKRWLEKDGHTVHAAATCTEGLAKAEILKPDCILMDFHLPDGTALSLCQEVRKMLPKATPPIIIFSGNPAVEELAYRQCMADKFLFKDMNALRMLSSAISEVCANSQPEIRKKHK